MMKAMCIHACTCTRVAGHLSVTFIIIMEIIPFICSHDKPMGELWYSVVQ